MKDTIMKRTLKYFIITCIVIGISLPGCTTTKNITTRSELTFPQETGTIHILTNDSSFYQLKNYSPSDSFLQCTGTIERYGKKKPFTGVLEFSDIQYIQTTNFNFWKTLLAAGSVGVIGSIAISNMKGESGLSVNETIRHYSPHSGSGGEGSCPYVYSWDGERYMLDAETFGIGFGKALELNTCTVLPSLNGEDGILKIKIANERPETHYFNAVQLIGIEVDNCAQVYLNANDTPWASYQTRPPICANDNGGRNILTLLSYKDGMYWESEIVKKQGPTSYNDIIEVSFLKPKLSQNGSIIIAAINTEFSNIVFKNVFEFLGDQVLSFMQAVEHDPEMINTLRDWIQESSLKVSIWDQREWKLVSILHPEATAAPFSRLVRINTDNIAGDTIRIRLSALADVWKIDAIRADWSQVEPLEGKPMKMMHAIGPKGNDISKTLTDADDKYTILFPPESIELKFHSLTPKAGKKIVYALNAQGYLYEWFPPNRENDTKPLFAVIPSSQRVGYLINLLQHKSIFLPPIYAEWIQTKNNHKEE